MKWRFYVLRACVVVGVAVSMGAGQYACADLEIIMSDPNADYFAEGTNPCPRGGAHDDCDVTAYIRTQDAGSKEITLFRTAWDNWNDSLPQDEKWTLFFYDIPDAIPGVLPGAYVWITEFDTYNDCPGKGGVKIQADPFRAIDGLPSRFYWAQGIHTNQMAGVPPEDIPHDSKPDPEMYYMDISTDPAHAQPPLYPGSDEHFSDRPGRVCLENSTVYWDAVAMLTTVDREERLMTVYGGFSYGFKIVCTPEPATCVLMLTGMLAASGSLWRRKRRAAA